MFGHHIKCTLKNPSSRANGPENGFKRPKEVALTLLSQESKAEKCLKLAKYLYIYMPAWGKTDDDISIHTSKEALASSAFNFITALAMESSEKENTVDSFDFLEKIDTEYAMVSQEFKQTYFTAGFLTNLGRSLIETDFCEKNKELLEIKICFIMALYDRADELGFQDVFLLNWAFSKLDKIDREVNPDTSHEELKPNFYLQTNSLLKFKPQLKEKEHKKIFTPG